MSFLKKIRWVYLVSSLVLVGLGIVCIAAPQFIAGVLCYVSGALLLVFGIGKVIRYFASRSSLVDSLVVGVLLAMLGFILVTRPDQVLDMIFVFVGILLLLDGIVKLKNAFVARAGGKKDWTVLLVISVIVLAFGIIVIANPFAGYVPIIVLGVAVLVDGLQNLYAALRVSFLEKEGEKRLEKNVTVEEYSVESEEE